MIGEKINRRDVYGRSCKREGERASEGRFMLGALTKADAEM